MTIKEKILEAFPNARFITYDSDNPFGGQPSVCSAELGLIDVCPCDMTCEICWGLECDEKTQLKIENRWLKARVEYLEKENKGMHEDIINCEKALDRLYAERGQIENVD